MNRGCRRAGRRTLASIAPSKSTGACPFIAVVAILPAVDAVKSTTPSTLACQRHLHFRDHFTLAACRPSRPEIVRARSRIGAFDPLSHLDRTAASFG